MSGVFYLSPIIGCGVFDRYEKNTEGFYENHFGACGPIALEKAFHKLNVGVSQIDISKTIQKDGIASKEILSLFHKKAIHITWPSEMKKVAKKYGFKIISVSEFESLDPKKDVAVILIHSNINDYHWVCFPIDDDIANFFGENTEIDKIYILQKI